MLVIIIYFKIRSNTSIDIYHKLQPSIMDASSISRGTSFVKQQNIVMVKGIHNELNIQSTENKLPYICKYCNTKGTDILCKINVRQKAH